MTAIQTRHATPPLQVSWNKLPEDFVLPDDPVESNLQPLLAAALRESLELAGLILEASLIASNFGICATVDHQTVVKAPDWVYIPKVEPLNNGVIRRSYTPNIEGDRPLIVMEFISETEGNEYSINPYYPYGKWYFYEQILRVPLYIVFHPKTARLDVNRLVDGKYQSQPIGEDDRVWLPEIGLFIGLWEGRKAELCTTWLRWWDEAGNLLLWGQEHLDFERQRVEAERQRAEQETQRADQETQRAEQEAQRADQETNRAEQEKQRAEQAELALEQERITQQRLLAKLRALGIEPDEV